jgi:hypothetical protein
MPATDAVPQSPEEFAMQLASILNGVGTAGRRAAVACEYIAARDAALHATLIIACREGLALAEACEASESDPDYTAMIEAVRTKLRAALATAGDDNAA